MLMFNTSVYLIFTLLCSTSNSITYADFSWRYMQICTRSNEIIVQQWPIIRIQDVVTFGVSVTMHWFYFRHANLSILRKTRQGAGPLAILVSGLWQAEPHRPVAKQQGDWMLTPRARQIEECRHWQQIHDAGNGLKDPTAPISTWRWSGHPYPHNTIQATGLDARATTIIMIMIKTAQTPCQSLYKDRRI